MISKRYQYKKQVIYVSETGISLSAHSPKSKEPKTEYPFDLVQLYQYENEEAKVMFHLVIQEAAFSFSNFIFQETNDLVEDLLNHSKIKLQKIKAIFKEIGKSNGLIELENKHILSWGSVYDTGSYCVYYTFNYRKEYYENYELESNIEANNNFQFMEEVDVNITPINIGENSIVPFEIWKKNEAFWKEYYKNKKENEKKSGCYTVAKLVFIIIISFFIILFIASLLP